MCSKTISYRECASWCTAATERALVLPRLVSTLSMVFLDGSCNETLLDERREFNTPQSVSTRKGQGR